MGEPEAAERERVLPAGVPCVAIEAGATGLWWRYVGARGRVIGIDQFGASAPAKDLFPHFGFTVGRVTEAARAVLADDGEVALHTADQDRPGMTLVLGAGADRARRPGTRKPPVARLGIGQPLLPGFGGFA